MKKLSYNATVTNIHFLTPDQMILCIRTDKPRVLNPGSLINYVGLGLMVKEKRSRNSTKTVIPLSVVNSDDDYMIQRPYLIVKNDENVQNFEFYISQIKSGQLTPRLFNLKADSRIWVEDDVTGIPSLNQFPTEINLVMVSTGTSLAAYINMIQSYVKQNKKSKLAVIQGAEHSWDLGFYRDLSFLENFHHNFYYFPTILESEKSWGGLTGYIEEHIKNNILKKNAGIELNPEKTYFLLSGNPTMIKAVSKVLAKQKYSHTKLIDTGYLYLEN